MDISKVKDPPVAIFVPELLCKQSYALAKSFAMKFLTALSLLAALAASSPTAKQQPWDDISLDVSERFRNNSTTLTERDEELQKRQPGGVSTSTTSTTLYIEPASKLRSCRMLRPNHVCLFRSSSAGT
jgi:hypothetical protein